MAVKRGSTPLRCVRASMAGQRKCCPALLAEVYMKKPKTRRLTFPLNLRSGNWHGDTGGFTATTQAGQSASTPRSGDELDPHHQGTQIDGAADSQGTEVDLAQSQQSSPYSLANSSSDTPERDTAQDLDYTK